MFKATNRFAIQALSIIFASAAMILAALPTNALAATKYKIDVELVGDANASTKLDGVMASASLPLVAGGSNIIPLGAIGKPNHLRITLTVSEPEGETVMLDLKIELQQANGSFTTSTSKVKAILGTATNMAVETDKGAELDLSLKVTKAP